MLKLEIDAENSDLPEDFKGRIQERFGDLDKYMQTLDGGRVAVSTEGGKRTKVSAQIWGPGHQFEASDTDTDANTAIAKTHHKLETQIRREHGREISARDHRH